MRSNARSRQRGFTLLELLVALTVFGLLMVGLSQGLRTGFALWRGQTQRLSEDSELDSSARVLRQLLTDIPTILRNGVVLPGMGPAAIGMNGTADSLAFVGDLPTGLGTIRRADMRIELRGDRLLLRWTPHRHEVAVEPRSDRLHAGGARSFHQEQGRCVVVFDGKTVDFADLFSGEYRLHERQINAD